LFFYLGLASASTNAIRTDDWHPIKHVRCADRVLELYGVGEFLAEIEIGRQYWRDGGGIVAEILDWAAGAGFPAMAERSGLEFHTAHGWRNRDLIRALRGRIML
jgi:hypothetical protein